VTDYAPNDLSRLRALSLTQRPSTVRTGNSARPTVNVVQRPAGVGGRGFSLNGRHELLIPLLAFAAVEALGG